MTIYFPLSDTALVTQKLVELYIYTVTCTNTHHEKDYRERVNYTTPNAK